MVGEVVGLVEGEMGSLEILAVAYNLEEYQIIGPRGTVRGPLIPLSKIHTQDFYAQTIYTRILYTRTLYTIAIYYLRVKISVKIVKFWSELWNFGQNCVILVKVVQSFHNCEIHLKLWHSVEIVIFSCNCEILFKL